MIASARSLRAWLPVAALLTVVGCNTVTPQPSYPPIEPLPTLGNYVPDEIDALAHSIAAAISVD